MNERLEEIKERFKAMNELPSFKKLAPTELFFDDIDYLIQQAERVGELDYENKGLKHQSEQQGADIAVLEHENQRYKQALKEIARQHDTKEIDDDEFMYNAGRLARQALEESE